MIDREQKRKLLKRKLELIRKLDLQSGQVENNVRQAKPRVLLMAELADINDALKT